MLAAALGYIDSVEGQKRFEELYYTYKNIMYKVSFSILKNPQDAEDALQEAFISIAMNSRIAEYESSMTDHAFSRRFERRMKKLIKSMGAALQFTDAGYR